jgi:hypothetical protein
MGCLPHTQVRVRGSATSMPRLAAGAMVLRMRTAERLA